MLVVCCLSFVCLFFEPTESDVKRLEAENAELRDELEVTVLWDKWSSRSRPNNCLNVVVLVVVVVVFCLFVCFVVFVFVFCFLSL